MRKQISMWSCLTVLVGVAALGCDQAPGSAASAGVLDSDATDDAAGADSADGAHVPSCGASRDDALPWARCIWGPWQEFANAVAFDPTTGDLIVAGDLLRDSRVNGQLTQPDGEQDGFVARWSATGKLLAWKRIGGPFVKSNADHVQRVRVADDGAIFVAGTYGGDMELGTNCTLPGDQIVTHSDRRELFLARLDSQLNCVWAKRGVSADFDEVNDLALLPNHTGVVVSGYVGMGTLGLATGRNGFVAAYDRDGKPLWGHAGSESTLIQAAGALAVAPDGRVAWAASAGQAGTFAGFELKHAPFIAFLSAKGAVTAVRLLPGPVTTLAFGAEGNLTVVGAAAKGSDFGNGIVFQPDRPLSSYLGHFGGDGTAVDITPIDLQGTAPMGELTASSAAVRILADGGVVAAIRSSEAGNIGTFPISGIIGTVLARYDAKGVPTAVQGPWPAVTVNEIEVDAGGTLALVGAYKGDTQAAGVPLQAAAPNPDWTDMFVLRMVMP